MEKVKNYKKENKNFILNKIKYEIRGNNLFKMDKSKRCFVKVTSPSKEEKDQKDSIIKDNKQIKIKNNLSKWTTEILNEEARNRDYDDIISARSYTGYPNIYQKESSDLASWSSNIWLVLSKILPKVISGNIKINSKEDLKKQLPSFKESK